MPGAAQTRLAVDLDLKPAADSPKPAISLAALWPEPDWAQCIANGVSPHTTAILAMLYQGFATAPMRDKALGLSGETHIQLYEACVASMQKLFEQATKEDLDTLARQFHSLTGVPRDSNGVPIEVMLRYFALGRPGGRSIRSPFALSQRASSLAMALPDLGWPADTRALKTGICHWRMRTGAYGVAKFTGTGIQQLIKPRLTREAATREALRLIDEELDRHQRERRSIPKRVQAGELQRTNGEDIRAGAPITIEQLMARYRLREVRVGTQGAQEALNNAYDALHDLSVATGLPPGWIGLSKLSLHLGARTASYDPAERTLAISKGQGTGTLAKVWAKALDHHLAKHTLQVSITPDKPFLTQHRGLLPSLHREDKLKHEIAVSVLRILNYIESGSTRSIQTTERSEYLMAAQKIESLVGSKKNFWTAPDELFSRAFEAYVQDRLSSASVISPWLVCGTLASDLSTEAAADPYPQGDDRRRLSALIQELMQAIPQAARKTS